MTICLPPPADRSQLKAELELKNSLADMLANAMLESDMPEHKKVGVRLVQQAKAVRKQLNEIVTVYAAPNQDEEKDKAMHLVRKEVYDFLEHIESEMTEFISTHPLPVDTQD